MNKMKLIILSVLTISLAGWYFPFKWDAWRYEGSGVDYVSSPYDTPSKDGKYEKLFVGDVYVHSFLKAHNETTQGGDPPYQMIITFWRLGEEQASVRVHDVKVISSIDSKVYEFVPIECDARGKKTQELRFPVQVDLELKKYGTKSFVWNGLHSDYTIDSKPETGEKLTAFLDIEIISTSKKKRSVVKYEFTPKYEEGVMGYIE